MKYFFFLKSSVGYKWLVDLFDDIRISFSREKSGLKLSHILKNSPEPNKKERDRKSNMPTSSFWEIYEHEEGYWCKRTNPDGCSFNLVAGFDALIPWSFVNIPEIINLQDLAIYNDIGISFPPQVFQAGIEEIILRIEGETYSFSVYISDETPLEFYHEMASTFYSIDIKGDVPMNFAMGFQGVQLLDMFHKQMMPGYKRVRKEKGFMMGQSGPKGNAISFYPSMPKGFNKTKEAEEFSFTIPGHKEVDYKKMEKELEKNISLEKNNVGNYTMLASLFIVQGRFQEVIILLTNAESLLNPNSVFHGIFGSAYANLGRFNEALVEFKKAESLEPNNPKVQNSLALCLQELGEDESALVHFENAIRLEPTNIYYHVSFSRALGRLNKITDAITPARKAVSLDPEDIENIILLGMLLNLNEQIDEALILFEKAIQINSNSSEAYQHYAQILAKKGDIEKAIENFEHSIKLKKDIDCYADLGRLLCDNERWDEAESVINEGLSIDPNYHGLLIYLGVVKANQGNFNEAIKKFEKANSINPSDKTALKLLEQVKGYSNIKVESVKKKK